MRALLIATIAAVISVLCCVMQVAVPFALIYVADRLAHVDRGNHGNPVYYRVEKSYR